jgi:polyhydroxyalkanoate synthesis regulator phasin
MAETALIGLDVDLSLINRRLAEAGNLTAKEARSMQTELVQAFKHSARASEAASKQISRATSKAARDAERDAKKAAREVERSIEGQASAVRGLFSAAIGGVGGDLLDLADATDGASGSMAGLGIALGALAIGPAILGGLAQGMIETANAGVEAKNALEEAGIAVDQLVTPAALAAIEQYEKQTKLAEQASQALSVQLGGAAARDAGIFNDALLGVKQTLASASESTGGFFATVGKWAEFSVEYSSVGGYLLINSLREQGVKAGEAKAKIAELAAEQAALALETDAAAQAMEDERAMLVALGMLSEEDTATTNRATDAIKRQREFL